MRCGYEEVHETHMGTFQILSIVSVRSGAGVVSRVQSRFENLKQEILELDRYDYTRLKANFCRLLIESVMTFESAHATDSASTRNLLVAAMSGTSRCYNGCGYPRTNIGDDAD